MRDVEGNLDVEYRPERWHDDLRIRGCEIDNRLWRISGVIDRRQPRTIAHAIAIRVEVNDGVFNSQLRGILDAITVRIVIHLAGNRSMLGDRYPITKIDARHVCTGTHCKA